MYISEYEFTNRLGYGYHINPNVKISIEDCSGSDGEYADLGFEINYCPFCGADMGRIEEMRG